MKKKAALLGLSLVAGFALVGCNETGSSSESSTSGGGGIESSTTGTESSTTGTESSTRPTTNTTVNIVVNYKGQSGISYRQDASYLGVNGKTYVKGDLLPVWEEVQKKFNVKIVDSTDYSKADDNSQFDALTANQAGKFKDANGNQVELVNGKPEKMSPAAERGELLAISDYLDQMPNFRAWLQKNKAVKQELQATDGKIYFAPYFDGKDDIEKMFLMNTTMVAKLLDSDTTTYDNNVTINNFYDAQVGGMSNEKITVVNKAGTGVEEITVNFTAANNPVTLQNALQTKNGVNLVKVLKDHIDAVYGAYIGEGKLYSKRSEIFTSQSACYNADELIALMRCAKANPKLLTGGNEIHVLFPRTNEANRQRQILEFAQIWGVRGLSSEKDKLYFTPDGTLMDGRTQTATYDALELLNKLYKEQLIEQNYLSGYGGASKGDYRNAYMMAGTGFMNYDYNATSTVYDKTGTSTSKTEGYMPILPPVVKWEDGSNKYIRFSEDVRELKTGGWCIPNNCDADARDAALKIMDYFFSEEGANLQDYGPNTTDYVDGTIDLAGKSYPKISEKLRTAMGTQNWNDFYRKYVGATHGIGHVRSAGLDYQVTAPSGQIGLTNIQNAIKLGAMKIATSTGAEDNDDNYFYQTVFTNWSISTTADTAITSGTADMIALWREEKVEPCEYSNIIINGFASSGKLSRATIEGLFATTNNLYLKAYREVWNNINS